MNERPNERKHPNRGVFAPEHTRSLAQAFDIAWKSLSFAFESATDGAAVDVRRRIAFAIIDRAREGEFDSAELARHAIAILPPLESRWARLGRPV